MESAPPLSCQPRLLRYGLRPTQGERTVERIRRELHQGFGEESSVDMDERNIPVQVYGDVPQYVGWLLSSVRLIRCLWRREDDVVAEILDDAVQLEDFGVCDWLRRTELFDCEVCYFLAEPGFPVPCWV